MKPQTPDQFRYVNPSARMPREQSVSDAEIAEIIDQNTSELQNGSDESSAEMVALVEKWIPESSYSSFVVNPENGKNIKVIDVDSLKEQLKIRRRTDETNISREKIAMILFEKYKDEPVLTPRQVQSGDYQPKPLFYYPASVNAATDILDIVDADFHLPLWDLDTNSVLRTRDSRYPTQDGADMSSFEARVALKLFHPAYGDGRRNPRDGKMYFKNPDYNKEDSTSQKRVPLSRDVLRQYGIFNILQRELTGGRTPEYQSIYKGLDTECPHLVANGALNVNDFRQFTITREGDTIIDFEKKVGSNGYLMLRGVNQYVGRRFVGCTVTPFGEDKATIFSEQDGYKKLVALFTIVDKSNASEVYVAENGNQIPRANADKTQVIEIKYERLVPEGVSGLTGVLLEQKRKEVATRVSQSVEQLLDVAKKTEALVREELHTLSEDELSIIVEQVRSTLLSQAERAIAMAASLPDIKQLDDSLVTSEVSARAFVALMQKAGVEKMVKEPLDIIPAHELSPEERDQMRRLLQLNYETTYPGEDQIEFRKKIAESLESAFNRESTNFYLLKDGDRIVSFNRFDTVIDSTDARTVMYFGSFNADPKYRGVGGMMLEHTIQEKLQECDVMQAHCDPDSDISKKYIEDGFVATNTETVAGKFSFEIWRSRDSSERLVTKNKIIPELLAVVNRPHSPSDSFFVRTVSSSDEFHELDKDLGYVLTRYFTVKGVTYAAFEIPPADVYNQFIPAKQ